MDPPASPSQYQPRYDGVRPCFGLFVRYAVAVTVSRSSLGVASGAFDGRPAIVLDQVDGLRTPHVLIQTAGSPCQLEERSSTGNWSGLEACRWAPNRTTAAAPAQG